MYKTKESKAPVSLRDSSEQGQTKSELSVFKVAGILKLDVAAHFIR